MRRGPHRGARAVRRPRHRGRRVRTDARRGRERLAGVANVELRERHIEALPIDDDALDAAVLFLVAHFITDPAKAMREIRRVLKPGGRLLIVDLMSHDRVEYVVQLGHVWQGFDGEQVKEWLANAGFTACRYRPLPADPEAKGPALFVATAQYEKYRSRHDATTSPSEDISQWASPN